MNKSPPSSYLNRLKPKTSPTSRLLQQFAESRRAVEPGQSVPAVRPIWQEQQPGWNFSSKSRKVRKNKKGPKKSVRKSKKVRKNKKSRKTKK
jgi:hypothetical protein